MPSHASRSEKTIAANAPLAVRTTKRMERAKRRIDMLRQEVTDYYAHFRVTPDLIELRNLVEVADLGSKKDGESEKKHREFVERMVARGYTERQVRRLVEWYMRVKKSG